MATKGIYTLAVRILMKQSTFRPNQYHLQKTAVIFTRFCSNNAVRNYNPLIICGPSGVGKGTITNHLTDNHSQSFGTSISHTTRAPRKGEEDNVHYKFIPNQLFEEGINNNQYIEYACTHGNYYGTHSLTLDALKSDGKICILEIDVKGAKQVKEYHNHLDCNFIFVTAKSPLTTLEQRLSKRGTETTDQIKTRLDTAQIELDFLESNPDFFHHILMNEDLNDCIKEMTDVLNKLYPWLCL